MTDNKYYIDISKYPFLQKIDNDYINIIIDNMFETGYNLYIRNQIKNEVIQNESINYATENKFSSTKGTIGENIVQNILIEKFKDCIIENTSKIPHAGDMQITFPSKNKLIVEVKNYNKTIDQEQLDKLKFDMKYSGIYNALFISLNSGIVGKKKFEIETYVFNKKSYYILYIPYAMHKSIPEKKYMISHNSIEDSIPNLSIKIEFGICILQNIYEKFKNNDIKGQLSIMKLDIDYIIGELDKFNTEFKTVKSSANKLEENIKKSIESHQNSIKEYELSIRERIDKLIKKKLNDNIFLEEKDKIKIKKNKNNSEENWNILINNKVCGKIININSIYDILINYDGFIINEQYNNLDECLRLLNNFYLI
jgi:hypothetical protein